jgi:hypothetical protein
MATGAVASPPAVLQPHSSLVRDALPTPPSITVASADVDPPAHAKPVDSPSQPSTPSLPVSASPKKSSAAAENDWHDTDSLYEEALDDCEPFQYSNGKYIRHNVPLHESNL